MQTPIRFPSVAMALAAALTLATGSTLGADSAPSTASHSADLRDPLAAPRALIAQDKWVAAIEELKRVGERDGLKGNADWNNLMGYSHRKARTPDHAAAERYYNEALRIDPQHRGALEYSGELYLTLGDLPRAEARLATLGQVCAQPCAEQAKLKQAIAAYQANGNRPVRTP